MDFKKLATQAKTVIDKRGGTEGLKGDFEQLREIAKGNGSVTDKAKAAAEALKQPSGAAAPATEETHEAKATQAAETAGGSAPPVANAGVKRQAPGKHKGQGAAAGTKKGKQGRNREAG